MNFKKALMGSAVVAAAFASASASAAAAAPTLSDIFSASGITVGGAVDASYDWSDNDSVGGHQFDNEDDAFVFHQLNLSVSKAFAGGIGATINAVAGEDANVISGDGTTDDFDLTQAFVSYSSGNLSVIGGRYVTLAGMEVINPSGNLNASRSFLFFFQPFVHTGARATYKINDMISVTAGLNNAQFGGTRAANSSAPIDNNKSQTLEAQVALTPLKNASVYLTIYSGNEDDSNVGASHGDADRRFDTVDLVVNYSLSDSIYFGLNADYFNQENDFVDANGRNTGTTENIGVAGYAQVKVLPNVRVAYRTEYLSFDGQTGADGDSYLRSNTVTVGYAVSENLELLGELRADRFSGDRNNLAFDVIDRAGGDDDQTTGTVKAILKF